MFTRQHYKAIAETLRANRPGEPPSHLILGWTEEMQRTRKACREHHRCIVDQLANLFAQDNPRFNWQKFIDAAELE